MLFRYFQDPIRETVEDLHNDNNKWMNVDEVGVAGTGGFALPRPSRPKPGAEIVSIFFCTKYQVVS
jgi:hypothetical protein